MALTRKGYITIALLVAIGIGVALYFIFRKPANKNAPKSKVARPIQKPSVATPPGSPSSNWVDETFPLNVGMFGPYTQQLQAALGIPQDGKFGDETKAAVLARGVTVPLSKDNYNIIALVSQKVYAYSDGILIQNDDFTLNPTPVKEGDFLGTIQNVIEPSSTGPSAQLLGGSYLVNPSPGSITSGNLYVQMSDVFFGDLT